VSPDLPEDDRLATLTDEELMREYREEMARADAAGTLPPFLRFVRTEDA
jgi:hypothetical protein